MWRTKSTVLNQAELYNPAIGAFTPTIQPLNVARIRPSDTTLDDGTVLVTGGMAHDGSAIGSAELYNPATGTFTFTQGNLVTARGFFTAVKLKSGKVVLAGGDNSVTAFESAELYDPASQTFAATAGPRNRQRRDTIAGKEIEFAKCRATLACATGGSCSCQESSAEGVFLVSSPPCRRPADNGPPLASHHSCKVCEQTAGEEVPVDEPNISVLLARTPVHVRPIGLKVLPSLDYVISDSVNQLGCRECALHTKRLGGRGSQDQFSLRTLVLPDKRG